MNPDELELYEQINRARNRLNIILEGAMDYASLPTAEQLLAHANAVNDGVDGFLLLVQAGLIPRG